MTLDLVQEPTPSLPEILAPHGVAAGRRRQRTPRAHVVALVVARDGAPRLPHVLAALASATRPPDVLVGVDLGSRDDSAELLAAAMPALRLPRSATVADAVEAVLSLRTAGGLGHRASPHHGELEAPAPRAVRDGGGAEPDVVDWVWIVPHDGAPAPTALEQLLLAVETAPSVGVAGCKQVSWDDDQRLLDVGFTASPLGLRVTGVDRDEVDQGQHDGRSDVLAVSGAGMLVRRDVWDELGGLDPALGPAADLDLCRRAHLAGHRVVVVPGAVVARSSARPPRRVARRAVLHLRLAAAPLPLLPLAVAAVLLAAPLRALALLVAGRAAAARDELLATVGALATPMAWRRTRRRVRRARRVPPRALRGLLPTLDLLWRQRWDAVHGWLSAPPPDTVPPRARRRPGRAVAAALGPTLVAAAAGLVTARDLVLSGALPVGPGLLPAPSSAGALWSVATSSWRHVGLGERAAPDPFAALLALLSLPLGGDPARATRVLLVAALPAAALAAWTAAAAVTRSRVLRWWAALAWAAAPSLLSAVTSGRTAAVVAHVLLPVAAVTLARAADLCGRPATGRGAGADTVRARRPIGAACRLGLVLTALLAAAPALAVPGLAVLAGAGLAGRRRAVGPLALASVLPAALLLPWWVAVARSPGLLLTDPAVAALTAGPAPGRLDWLQALAVPVPPALPGLGAEAARAAGVALGAAVALPVVVAAVVGTLRRRGGGLAALGWWTAGVGLGGAAAVAAVAVTAPGGVPLAGVPGPCLSLALAGLGGAGLLGADVLASRARRARHRRAARLLRLLLAGGATVAVTGALAASAGTAWAGADLAAGPVASIPAVAAAEARGAVATRTLVLRVTGGAAGSPARRVSWALAHGAGPQLGDASADLAARELAGASPTQRDARVVLPAVADLLSDTGHDPRPRLADLAVGSVVLLPPADAGTTLALDASPGLVRLGDGRGAVVWRVEPPAGSGTGRPARARVVDPASGRATLALPWSSGSDGVDAGVPRAAHGRLVVLAERFDAGWHAQLDGVPLSPVRYQRWSQAFVLPAAGGRLEVTRDAGLAGLTAPARAGVLALALIAALQWPRLRGRAGAPPPARPSRPVPRPGPAPDGLRPAPAPRVFDDEHPEDATRPLYVGPLLRRRRRRRFRLRMRLRRRQRRGRAPGGTP
ncbi:MAG: glycosyltransferase [Kineosporiaceae bacterium]